MSVLKRVFYIYQDDNPDIDDLYQSLSQDLGAEISDLLVQHSNEPIKIDSWPEGNWSSNTLSVSATEREYGESAMSSLLKATIRFSKTIHGIASSAEILIGRSKHDKVIVVEERKVEIFAGRLEQDYFPEFSFLHNYRCKNEDGYRTDGIYAVEHNRVPKFVEFLKSDSRRLPVLLFSPGNVTAFDYFGRHEFASMLGGLVHLIRLADSRAVQQFSQHMPKHNCYNGATRLYWPHYRAEAKPREYPYWRATRYERLFADLLPQLASASLLIFDHNELQEHIQRQQQKQYKRSQTLLDSRLHAIQQKDQYQEKAVELEQLVEAAEQWLAERDDRIAELESELGRLTDENRSLRWRLNTAWHQVEDETEDTEQHVQLFLSRIASETLADIDGADRVYWEQHVFPKLLRPQQLEAQSEPVKGDQSQKCFVYPRSNSAGGRRVIYFCKGHDTYVCELLTHDVRYQKLRTEGVDPAAYNEFRPWQGAELVLKEAPASYIAELRESVSSHFEEV